MKLTDEQAEKIGKELSLMTPRVCTAREIGRAAEEATRELHYREALAAPVVEESVRCDAVYKMQGVIGDALRSFVMMRLAVLIPTPDPAIEAVLKIVGIGSLVSSKEIAEKVVAAVDAARGKKP